MILAIDPGTTESGWVTFRDGKVVDSVDGWDTTDPESREQLIALLQRTGLLEAGTR